MEELQETKAQETVDTELPLDKNIKLMSPTRMVVRRFFRSRLSIIGLIMVIGLFLFSFLGPVLIADTTEGYTDAGKWGETELDRSGKVEYSVNTLLELRMLEMEMYFRQPKRIARCAHCWNYFLPKTKKETLYCDREWEDEKTCKQLGSIAQRRVDRYYDTALELFEAHRKRMSARHERYMQSNQKINTEFMLGINEYFDWSEIAKQARMDYLDGKISAEEFIRRIDMYGELKGFTVQKTEQTGESILEKLVKQDLTFDPARRYFDVQTLDLEEPNPLWKIMTAEEWIRSEQGSRRPLAEQVEEIHPRKIDEEE
jgi:hypothetical protein